MMQDLDPLLGLIAQRPLQANNVLRARIIARAALTFHRDPEGFERLVMSHLCWSNDEAVARDRAGDKPALAAPGPLAAIGAYLPPGSST